MSRDNQGRIQWRYWRGGGGQLTHNYILSLCQDNSGLLWIGTWGGGLNCPNPQTGEIKYWVNDPADPYSVSYNDVWCIYEDRMSLPDRKAGNIWIGTDDDGHPVANGVYLYRLEAGPNTMVRKMVLLR
ncbi:MAG: hypothetical protein Kow0042_01630 [Calditrichia bacterium]